MTLSLDHRRVLVPSRVLARTVEGATVLLNTETGRYFTLDEIGTRVWTHLIAAPSIQHACERLLDEYGVDADELTKDVEALVEDLERRGLVEIGPAEPRSPEEC